MKVLLTGGGTGGHINPALAIGQCIQAHHDDVEILYVGTPNGMEATLVPKAGYVFEGVSVQGFHRKMTPKEIKYNCKTVKLLLQSQKRIKEILQEFQPDVVIGTGGYVAGPVVRAAAKAGIKTMIHEQNAFPGVTNKILAKQVDVVLLAFKEAKSRMKIAGKCVTVGNPVRASIAQKTREQARRELGMDDDFCIFSVGGSLGAKAINEMAADLMQWNEQGKKCNHIHGFGGQGRVEFPKMLQERGVDLKKAPRIRATEYIDQMDTCLMAADLVISRCGAMTLSELEITGKPSILVPSPYVAENHQYYNGMVLVANNAAYMIEQHKYDKAEFLALVEKLRTRPDKLLLMSQNVQALAINDTTERIYQELKLLLNIEA